MVYLYRNLKILRKKLDLTQAESAAQCGFATNTWSNYENGVSEPDLETALKISQFLGVSLDELIAQDLSDAHLIEKIGDRKKHEDAHLNAHPNAHLTGKKEGFLGKEDRFENEIQEPGSVGTWALMGQIKGVDEKIDQLRLLVEKALKK